MRRARPASRSSSRLDCAGLQVAGQGIGVFSVHFQRKRLPEVGPSGRRKKLRGIPALLVEIGVLLAETVNTAGGIEEALLAGEERMAGGADFHMHVFALCREGFHLIAAGAGGLGLVHFRMNLIFHGRAPIKSGLSHIYPVGGFGKRQRTVVSGKGHPREKIRAMRKNFVAADELGACRRCLCFVNRNAWLYGKPIAGVPGSYSEPPFFKDNWPG